MVAFFSQEGLAQSAQQEFFAFLVKGQKATIYLAAVSHLDLDDNSHLPRPCSILSRRTAAFGLAGCALAYPPPSRNFERGLSPPRTQSSMPAFQAPR